MTLHPFDAAIALAAVGDAPGRWTAQTRPDWSNMVGPFGGITAAQLLQAVCLDPRRLGDPLALTVNFAGPIADGSFEIEAQPSRTNRGTQHWSMTLRQNDQVCTTASAVCAVRRDTWSGSELPMPVVPAAEQVAATTRQPPVAWPRRYDFRFVEGSWPDFHQPTDEAESRSLLWVRDQPPRGLDAPALAALCDVFYPRVFRRRQRFTPAGTVSITTYFHADASSLAAQGERHLLARAQGRRFAQGYFDQSAELWSHDGQLLASSHQVVYFKD
jgi:acyl-coenzyme A thioesterase PaaI-like protein